MHMFTDKEAWGIYRFAAFVEAGFWGFFLLCIGYYVMNWPLSNEVLKYGRSIIGTAFAVYAILIVLAARSMEWKAGRVSLALLAGIVPFGSLIFEHFMGRHRKTHPVYIAPPKGYDE